MVNDQNYDEDDPEKEFPDIDFFKFSYLLGFLLGTIFSLFALLCYCCNEKKRFKTGLLHGIILGTVSYLLRYAIHR